MSYSITYSMLHPIDIPLADRDIVIVMPRANYPRLETATISGEIIRPGPYSINRRITTAQDLIVRAGGLTKYGCAEHAYIIRRDKVALVQKSLTPLFHLHILKFQLASYRHFRAPGNFDGAIEYEQYQ